MDLPERNATDQNSEILPKECILNLYWWSARITRYNVGGGGGGGKLPSSDQHPIQRSSYAQSHFMLKKAC